MSIFLNCTPKHTRWLQCRLCELHDAVTKPASVTGPKHVHTDVRGAPYRIGTSVRVARLVDETGNRRWLGRTGTVKFFDYACGCGQSFPDDPMIGVESPRGKVEEFWKEELRPIPARTARQRRVSQRG